MWRFLMALVTVAGVSFFVGRGTVPRKPSAEASAVARAQLVEDVLSAIRAYYVDSLDDAQLTRLAVEGIVARLRDPYSRLLDEDGDRRAASKQALTAASPSFLEDSIGFVALHAVSAGSATTLRREIAALQARGLRALILDLRANPGGLVGEATQVAELFLDKNLPIGWLKGRSEKRLRFVAVTPQQWPDLPLVVLVDGHTASAAELIAGSLQEHDRALIVGTQTFGKGLVQIPIRLREGLVLALTTARWYTARGRALDRSAVDASGRYFSDSGRLLAAAGGVVPDVVVPRDSADDPVQIGLGLLRETRTTRELLARAARPFSAVLTKTTANVR